MSGAIASDLKDYALALLKYGVDTELVHAILSDDEPRALELILGRDALLDLVAIAWKPVAGGSGGCPHGRTSPRSCPSCQMEERAHPQRPESNTVGSLVDSHWADLKRSGLSNQTIAAARIQSVSTQEATAELGFSGQSMYRIPYFNPDGTAMTMLQDGKPVPFVRYKVLPALGKCKYVQPPGSGNHLYFPPNVPAPAWSDPSIPLWWIEGEKKALKGAEEGLCAVAVGGVWSWREKTDKKQSVPIGDLDLITWDGRVVYICYDSDAATKPEVRKAEQAAVEELTRRGARVFVIRLPGPEKGLDDFLLMRPVSDLLALRPHAALSLEELLALAQPVLDRDDDVIAAIEEEVRSQGYGGTVAPVIVIYLGSTTRLLIRRDGSMPCHLIVIAPASSGKSYTESMARRFIPPEAQHEIKASSPRSLIYDDAELEHRTLIFGEADSLPSSEDNPAASAIRNLLQDGELSYDVVVKDPSAPNGFRTVHIRRKGPTQLITTTTRSFRNTQLGTRALELEIPTDLDKMMAALDTQATLTNTRTSPPNPALLALQSYLQRLAPWDVQIPFSRALSGLIKQIRPLEPRILRDHSKLLSLIKASAILHQHRRPRDEQGRVVAALEDYRIVRHYVGPLYETALAGVSESVRKVCMAVENGAVTVAEIKNAIEGSNRASVSRWVTEAEANGWLLNEEPNNKKPKRLKIGDPIPEHSGLPSVDAVAEAWGASGGDRVVPVNADDPANDLPPGVGEL